MSDLIMLNEVCKFSAIKATSALSKFLNIPLGFEMKIVEIKMINDESFFNNTNSKMASVFLPISGSVPGACFFLFSEDAALSLCDLLFHKPVGTTRVLLDPEISALTEVANIMTGHFLTNLSRSLQLDMVMHRSPEFDFAPFKDTIMLRFPKITESLREAVFSISFSFQHVNIQGYVVIILSKEKLNFFLNNITLPTDV